MSFIKRLWDFLNRPEPEDLERINKWQKETKKITKPATKTKKQTNKTLSSNF